MAVFNFGSINIDHVYAVPHFVQPGETLSASTYHSTLGGKGANQSIALARAGNEVFHVGVINKNEETYLQHMMKCGVNCQFVRKFNDIATGHAIIQVNPQAENNIILYGGANQTLSEAHITSALASAKPNDWVLLQNETNAIAFIINEAHKRKLRLAFNPAPMTDVVKSMPLEKVALLIVNEVEAQQLTGLSDLAAIKQALRDHYHNTQVLLTLGKAGVWYIDATQEQFCSAFDVEAIDTTAAGDTFIGYYMAAMQAHKSVADSLRYACAASALAVMKHGASASVPSVNELSDFLMTHE